MALDQNQLEQDVKNAINALESYSSMDELVQYFAKGLAQAIHSYVSAAAVRNVQVDLGTGEQIQDGDLY